jgi:hypothetical protein
MKQMSLVLGSILILILATLAATVDRADSSERYYGANTTAHRNSYYRRLKRRYLWGPAQMPPAPTDFGPYFDFPPEPLNGGLSHDPYPN